MCLRYMHLTRCEHLHQNKDIWEASIGPCFVNILLERFLIKFRPFFFWGGGDLPPNSGRKVSSSSSISLMAVLVRSVWHAMLTDIPMDNNITFTIVLI